MRAFFEAADVDKSGTVSFQEVVKALVDETLGVGISEEDAKAYALMVFQLQTDPIPFSCLIPVLPAARGRYEVDRRESAAFHC